MIDLIRLYTKEQADMSNGFLKIDSKEISEILKLNYDLQHINV